MMYAFLVPILSVSGIFIDAINRNAETGKINDIKCCAVTERLRILQETARETTEYTTVNKDAIRKETYCPASAVEKFIGVEDINLLKVFFESKKNCCPIDRYMIKNVYV